MLHIAVAGMLANKLEHFDLSNVHDSLQITPLKLPIPRKSQFDLIIALNNDDSGEKILSEIIDNHPRLRVIISHWNEVPSANYLNEAIQKSLLEVYGFIVGYSNQMHVACQWIRAVSHQAAAAFDLRTLVVGESGTGKELVASAIHKLGFDKTRPYVTINSGGLPEGLIDSELFGHKRGAFTTAISDYVGVLQRAGNGLLFLDEIGDLPLMLQVKLLRVLEERTFSPLGSSSKLRFSAQVVSATNRRLDEAVRQGLFRADLYFRIAQLTILLPPLRERRQDFPLFMRAFLDEHGVREEMEEIVGQEVLKDMLSYDWPGNIRELKSAITKILLLWRNGHQIGADDWQLFPPLSEPLPRGGKTLADLRGDFDRKVLEEVLSRHGGSTKLAAEELGITRRSIYNLIKRHGMDPRTFAKD